MPYIRQKQKLAIAGFRNAPMMFSHSRKYQQSLICRPLVLKKVGCPFLHLPRGSSGAAHQPLPNLLVASDCQRPNASQRMALRCVGLAQKGPSPFQSLTSRYTSFIISPLIRYLTKSQDSTTSSPPHAQHRTHYYFKTA
jgi:hypothetical protein